jgi:hypothetical protein
MVLATMREAAGLSAADVPAINVDSQLASQYADVLREAYAEKKGTGEYSWLNPHARIVKHGGIALLQRLLSATTEPKQDHEAQDGKVIVNWGKVVEGEGLTVVIAGSGTSIHGRVCREIMEHAKNPEAIVLLCGYCPEASMGGQLRAIASCSPAERETLPALSMRIRDARDGTPRFWEQPADAVEINLADLSAYYRCRRNQPRGSVCLLLGARGCFLPSALCVEPRKASRDSDGLHPGPRFEQSPSPVGPEAQGRPRRGL